MEKTINEIESQTISFLRIPLTIGVVFIHASWPGINSSTIFADGKIDLFEFLRMIFSKYLPAVSVPLFFVFSGYLFFLFSQDLFSRNDYYSKIKKRIRTLLVPYVFWNILTLLIILFVEFLYLIRKGDPMLTIEKIKGINLFSIFLNFDNRGEPIDGPLWYVRDLFIIFLFSPILYKAIKWAKQYILVLLFLSFYLNNCGFPIVFGFHWFYFSIGAYLSIENKSLISQANKYKKYSYYLTPVFLILSFISFGTIYEDLFLPIYILVACFAVFNLGVKYIEKGLKYNHVIADASFFIFALHKIIIYYIDYIYRRLFVSESMECKILEYFLVPVIVIAICFIIYYILKRFFTKILVLTTGNR